MTAQSERAKKPSPTLKTVVAEKKPSPEPLAAKKSLSPETKVTPDIGERVTRSVLVTLLLLALLYNASKATLSGEVPRPNNEPSQVWEYPADERQAIVELLLPQISPLELAEALDALPAESQIEGQDPVLDPGRIDDLWTLYLSLGTLTHPNQARPFPQLVASDNVIVTGHSTRASASCKPGSQSGIIAVNFHDVSTEGELLAIFAHEGEGHLAGPFPCEPAVMPSIEQLWKETYAQVAALHLLTDASTHQELPWTDRLLTHRAGVRLYRSMLSSYQRYAVDVFDGGIQTFSEYPFIASAYAAWPINHISGRELGQMLAVLGPEAGREYLEMISDIREQYQSLYPGAVVG